MHQEDGSAVTFLNSGGTYAPSAPRFDATLVKNGGNYIYTRRGSAFYTFDVASGHLLAEADLAGSKASPPYQTTLAYDGNGHLSTITDPAGRKYTLSWTGNHITALADQTGRQVSYGYDTEGNLTDVYGVGTTRTPTLQDDDHMRYTYVAGKHLMASMRTPANFAGPASAVTSMTYDTAERVTAQTDANGHTTTFTYGPDGGLTAGQTLVTDPAGHKDLQTYQNGLLVSETKGYGTSDAGTASYTYDPVTLGVTTQTDADGHVQTFTYDDHGHRTSASDALGFTTNYVFDTAGNVVETIDPNGVATVNGYDQTGHIPAGAAGILALTSETVTKANNVVESSTGNFGPAPTRTTNFYYDDVAHPADRTRVIDALGKTTSIAFDNFGDVTSMTDPLGGVTGYGYDTGRGWVTSTVDANNHTTRYDHDAHGQTTKTTDPLNHASSATFDADGRKTSTTDANNRTVAVAYDPVGQPVKVTQADNTSQVTHYNADGTVADVVDALGGTTHYGYDSQGRRASRTDPDNKVSSVKYDPAGRALTNTDAAGRVTTFGYDPAGRVASQSYSDGVTPNATYGYDPAGHRVAMSDGSGTSTWTYDTFGEVTAQKQGSGAVVGYTYDDNGHQTSITYPGQATPVNQAYDDNGRLKAVTDPAGKTTTFGYTKTNRVQSTSYPNGTTVTNGYDDRDGLTSTSAVTGSTTVLSVSYGRDAVGQLANQTTGNAPQQAFTYTEREQLASADTSAFSYDAANNPVKVGTTTQAFDAAGQLCWTLAGGSAGSCGSAPAGATTYTFDAVGNRTKSGTATTYGWDQGNRLTSYAGPGGSATYGYNGDGLRVNKTVGGTTTKFLWNSGQTPDLLSDGTTSYLYGPEGLPIEQIGPSGSAWFVHDQLGSTIGLLNASGAVGATYTYTAYGVSTSSGALSTPLRYTGQYTDAESGLLYLRARYYDAATTQFLSVDPAVDRTRQPYVYSGGNPVNYTDPTGMSFWSSLGAGLMIVGAVAAVGACALLEPCGAIAVTTAGAIAIDGAAVAGIGLAGAAAGGLIGGAMHAASTGGYSFEIPDWDPGDGEDDDGNQTTRNREEQQRQADAAWKQIERRAGRPLSKADRRLWHDAIGELHGDFQAILREGLHMFCEGEF